MRVGLRRVIRAPLVGLHRLRMVLSGLTLRDRIVHGTVTRCWYCGKEAVSGEVCERNPYTDSVFRYPHLIRDSILDTGRYL